MPIPVYFLLMPGGLSLDWSGPAEALRVANQRLMAQGSPPAFALHFIGPERCCATSVGVQVTGIEPLPDKLPVPAWLVLIGQPGNALDLNVPAARAALHWLRGLRLASGGLELVTVCAGSVLAAHAGLLGGRQATTHHTHLDELQRADTTCRVACNRVFVIDGPIASSAGVTTGIDLMIHRIAQTCGEPLAAHVAQALVMPLRRGPLDPEHSPFLAHRSHLHPALHRLQDAINANPTAPWSVARMAQVACVSPRHLARLFALHAQVAPLDYLRRIRLAVAERALSSGSSVTQAAEQAGFASDTQLRRAWKASGKTGGPARARSRAS